MKSLIRLCLSLCALLVGSYANAYYLEHAVAGTLTLEVAGACAIPKTVVKAYIADISDDERKPIGWGVITANGHLLALREGAISVVDNKNFVSKQQRSSEFINLAGSTLKGFLTNNGVRCEIAFLQSDISSRLTRITGVSGGSAILRTTVEGYEVKRCQDSGDIQMCKARKITGNIGFVGKW